MADTPPIQIAAPAVLGAQIEARAQHPALSDKPFLFEADRRWTYREYRDACVRAAQSCHCARFSTGHTPMYRPLAMSM